MNNLMQELMEEMDCMRCTRCNRLIRLFEAALYGMVCSGCFKRAAQIIAEEIGGSLIDADDADAPHAIVDATNQGRPEPGEQT